MVRGRLDIIADILDTAKAGIKKTELMYKARLSFKQVQYYSNFLTDCKLLCVSGNNGSVVYKTSDLGKEFRERYGKLKELLKD